MPANATRPVGHSPIVDDRQRNQLIKFGLASVVVASALALVLYLVISQGNGARPAEAKAVRVASSRLVTKAGIIDTAVADAAFALKEGEVSAPVRA